MQGNKKYELVDKKIGYFSVIDFPAAPINSEFIMVFFIRLWNAKSSVLKPQGR
jgi:hypothetical protein